MRAGPDVVYQATFLRLPGDGQPPSTAATPISSSASIALRARRLHLRGRRHQARPPRQALLHPPALLLHRVARASRAATARAHPRHPRHPRPRPSGSPSSPPISAACASASSPRSPTSPPPPIQSPRPLPGLPLDRRLRPARESTTTTSRSSPGMPSTSVKGSRRRDHDPRGARPASTDGAGRGIRAEQLDQAPRPGRAPARDPRRPASRRSTLLEPEPDRGFARLPAPSRRRHLLRPRGRPVLRRRPRVPVGVRHRRRRRARVHAPSGGATAPRSARRSSAHRPRRRAPRALARPARLPLRPLRDHRAQAAGGAARARARRRSTSCCATSVFVDLYRVVRQGCGSACRATR